jgi:hypothetical protein
MGNMFMNLNFLHFVESMPDRWAGDEAMSEKAPRGSQNVLVISGTICPAVLLLYNRVQADEESGIAAAYE